MCGSESEGSSARAVAAEPMVDAGLHARCGSWFSGVYEGGRQKATAHWPMGTGQSDDMMSDKFLSTPRPAERAEI
jgi:hypothetical protein